MQRLVWVWAAMLLVVGYLAFGTWVALANHYNPLAALIAGVLVLPALPVVLAMIRSRNSITRPLRDSDVTVALTVVGLALISVSVLDALLAGGVSSGGWIIGWATQAVALIVGLSLEVWGAISRRLNLTTVGAVEVALVFATVSVVVATSSPPS